MVAVAKSHCDHRALISDRTAWLALPVLRIVGDHHEHFQQKRCPQCSLILERSLKQPWPIEETDGARAARLIAEAAREANAHICQCSHERWAHIDGVAACLDGACPCASFRRSA